MQVIFCHSPLTVWIKDSDIGVGTRSNPALAIGEARERRRSFAHPPNDFGDRDVLSATLRPHRG
jgi:hypothetical protein